MAKELIITFVDGIYGFEDLKEFVFYKRSEDESDPFTIMQSTKDPSVNFIVIPPFLINNEYEIELDSSDIEELQIEEEKEVMVLSIVTVPKGGNYLSVNLKSPIVFSIKSKLGKQIILEKSDYEIRHKVMFGDK
jgi:flagellar assembly factor FliW